METLKTYFLKNHYDLLFGLLCLCIVLGTPIVNICFGTLLLLGLFKWKKTRYSLNNTLFFRFFGVLLVWVTYVYVEGVSIGVLSEKRFQLLYLLPLTLLIGTQIKSIQRVSLLFVASALMLCLIGFSQTLFYILQNKSHILTEGAHVNELLLIERPYVGFICLISILLCALLSRQLPHYKIYFWILMMLQTMYIVFISARLSFLLLIGLGVLYFLGYARLSIQKKAISLGVVFLGIIVSFASSKTLSERFFINQALKMPIETLKDYEPRIIIWSCASNIAQKDTYSKLFGMISTEKLTEELVQCYQKDTGNDERRAFFVHSKFNTHNQYFDLYLTTGIIGISLFLFFLINVMVHNRKNFYSTGLLLITCGFFLTENVLYRQQGVYLIAVVFVFIYHFSLPKKDIP